MKENSNTKSLMWHFGVFTQPSLFSINQCFTFSTDWTNAKGKKVVLVSEATRSGVSVVQTAVALFKIFSWQRETDTIWHLNEFNLAYCLLIIIIIMSIDRFALSAQSHEGTVLFYFVLFLTIQTWKLSTLVRLRTVWVFDWTLFVILFLTCTLAVTAGWHLSDILSKAVPGETLGV